MATITEALKTLGIIEKRIGKNCEAIQLYSSKVNTEKPYFDSDKEQQDEVKKLIQSNIDLQAEYRRLKKNIDYTNLMETVEFDGQVYTIADLLLFKRKVKNFILNTYNSLNERSAQMRLRNAPNLDGKAPYAERLYDEREKNTNIRTWEDLFDNITKRLETVNATTDLIEHFK